MIQDKTRLHVLEGGLRSTSTLAFSQSVRPLKRSFNTHQMEPCAGELTTAYRETERRLHTLLEDRSRIGRDLHDCVLQSLYAIGLSIETSQRSRKPRTAASKESNERTLRQLNHLIHEIREMIHELESGTVQAFDLPAELSALRATYEQTGQLRVKLDLQRSALEVLTNEEEREILNIVREALSNCVRHAHASRATVAIRMHGTRIRITIQDDGIGFPTAVGRPGGYGLANMEARAKKLGGTFQVQSKTGGGTHVITEFSLEPLLSPV